MRPVAGFALIGVSLFMLIGFLNAELTGSAFNTLLTLLVAVGIPGAAGTTLLYQHFGQNKRLGGSRDQLKRQTMESEILRLAGEHGGRLTVVEVVRELAVTHSEAEELLKTLQVRGFAEIEITESGMLVYNFPDVQLLGEKTTGKGVLDD